MDKLTSMRVFRQVVESGSFSSAANRLGMSKTSVTKHIQHLEAHLHVALLNRTTRKLALTDVGDAYFSRCTQILDDVDVAEMTVRDSNSRVGGLLRLNAPLDFFMGRTGTFLKKFEKSFPELKLDLHLSNEFIDPIEGGFDVTIRASKADLNSSLASELIASSNLALVGTRELVAKYAPLKSVEDLRIVPKVGYGHTQRSEYWELIEADSGQSLTIKVEGKLRSNNGYVLKDAALAGMGLALIPKAIVKDELASGELVEASDELVPPTLSIYAIFASNRHRSEKILKFVSFIKTAFTDII